MVMIAYSSLVGCKATGVFMVLEVPTILYLFGICNILLARMAI